jgi:hypothetical protein
MHWIGIIKGKEVRRKIKKNLEGNSQGRSSERKQNTEWS